MIWALTLHHQGAVVLAPSDLAARLRPAGGMPIDFDCPPARGFTPQR